MPVDFEPLPAEGQGASAGSKVDFEPLTGEEGGETATASEQEGEAIPRKASPGFLESLARSSVGAARAQAGAAYMLTHNDEDLQQHLLERYNEAQREGVPDTAGKVGGFIGGLAGGLGMAVVEGGAGGLPAIATGMGSQGRYDAFVKAGVRALEQGKSLEEATQIGKKAGNINMLVQTATGFALPGGEIQGGKELLKHTVEAGAAGAGGQLAENVTEKSLGLDTPIMEGVGQAAAGMAILPGGMKLAGMGLRALTRGGRGGGRYVPPVGDGTEGTQGTDESLQKGDYAIQEPETAGVPLQPASVDSQAVATGGGAANGAAPIRAKEEAGGKPNEKSDLEIAQESTDSLVNRTAVGPERNAAFTARRAASIRAASQAKTGDVLVRSDGSRLALQHIGDKAAAEGEFYGHAEGDENRGGIIDLAYEIQDGGKIEVAKPEPKPVAPTVPQDDWRVAVQSPSGEMPGNVQIIDPRGKNRGGKPTLLEFAKSKVIPEVAAKLTSESQVESFRAQYEKEFPPELKLAPPESVEEQKARLAKEAAAKVKAAELTDKEKMAKEAAKPLVGSANGIGQGDLLGGGDLLSNVALRDALPDERPRQTIGEAEASAGVTDWTRRNPRAPEPVLINDPNLRREAWYQGGKITVNRAFIRDGEHLRSVLNEEHGHHLIASEQGQAMLDAAAGANLGQAEMEQLRGLYQQRPNETEESWSRRLRDEFMAKAYAEQRPVWQRIVEQVRGWLARAGLVDLTDKEIARAMLRSLEHGGDQAQFRVGDARITFGPKLIDLSGREAITAYHGTPHEVDKFSTDKIGTGEGAQVYGWGLYFAGKAEVAESYQKSLTGLHNTDAKTADGKRLPLWVYRMLDSGQVADVKADFTRRYQEAVAAGNETHMHGVKEVLDGIKAYESGQVFSSGNKYSVSLDVNHEDLLDWDKPLSEQSPKVQAAALRALRQEGSTITDPQRVGGSDVYNFISHGGGDGAKRGSELLKSLGIDGIRYLDQGSRLGEYRIGTSGPGKFQPMNSTRLRPDGPVFKTLEEAQRWIDAKNTYNFVLFDESKIKITHQNGQPVGMGEAMEAGMRESLPGEDSTTEDTESTEKRERKASVFGDGDPTVTQVMGAKMEIGGRPVASLAADASSIAHQHELIRGAGDQLDTLVRPGENGTIRFEPDGFTHEAGGRNLIEAIKRELPSGWDTTGLEKAPYQLSALFNSIRTGWADGSLKEVFGEPVARRLFQTVQAPISHWGLLLHSLQRFGTALADIARDPLVHLQYEWGKSYDGETMEGMFDKVMRDLSERLGVAANELLAKNPSVGEFVDGVVRANMQDNGGRVYRKIQALFQPKSAKRLQQLLGDTKVMEEVANIVQTLQGENVLPKPRPGVKALTPKQQLEYLVSPGVADQVDAGIRRALREGERKAARNLYARENHLTEDEMMAYDDRTRDPSQEGPDPTPEQVEAGLQKPEFAHWGKLRQALADYSPVTLDLAQKVLREDFKGTKFKPTPEKAAEMRIDLAKLAKQPDAEVIRVLDAWHSALEEGLDVNHASPETQQRIRAMMESELATQLAARRQEFLNGFFDPKTFKRIAPSDKLRQLLNAGVEKDGRFQSEPVRKLVQKLTSLKASEFDEQAVKTRAEKNGWVQDKLIETSNREGWDKLDQGTRDYFEAVTFTKLAEGLQAAEERVTRRFLGGKDVSFEAKPARTLEERQASRNAAADKLRGIINAGAMDASMVERVAGKSAVNKLLPSMSDLVQKVFGTPFFNQSELKTRFSEELVNKLGIDPAQADKAWSVFERAFADKFAEAKARAAEKARAELTPKEKVAFKGRGIVEKIVRNINAGNLDSADILQAVAVDRGEREPPPADVARLKALGERLLKLQSLDGREMAEQRGFNSTPEQIEAARAHKESLTVPAQDTIKRDMSTLWSTMYKPLHLKSFTTMQGLRNVRDAAREYVVLNLLTKVGHLVRFPIHLGTQVATHFSSRGLAEAFEAAQARGNTLPSWELIANAYKLQWEGLKGGLKPAVVGGRAEALGRGEGRNVDGLMEQMNTFGRLDKAAEEFLAKGNYPMYVITKLLGIPKYAGRYISVVDQWQGNPAVYADLLHEADLEMQKAGWNAAQRAALTGELIKTMKYEIADATLEAGQVLAAAGEKVTPKQIEENAWASIKFRMAELMNNSKLPGDDIAGRAEALRRQLAWQDEVKRGIGAPIAKGIAFAGKIFPPLGAFSNAIGHGINWTVAKAPPGLHLLADFDFLGTKEPSNFFRTSLDKKQRLIESIGATMGGALLGGLILGGKARYNPFLTTAQERAEMEAEGRKPGTIDFMLPDGKVSTWSLIVGPMTIFAPWIAGFGATANLMNRRERQQAKLDAEAVRTGLPAGKVRDLDMSDWLGVAGQAAVTSILGSKTAGGWTTQFVDPNQGFAAKRTVAGQIAPFVPGLPGWGEIARMMGISMKQAQAGVWDYLVPLPGSGARALNVMGDPVGTRNGLQRVVQVLTGGSYPVPHSPEPENDAAYAIAAASGFHAPGVSPSQGYDVGGTFRPLNNAELGKFTEARGKLFKAAVAALGSGADRDSVKAAFDEATRAALEGIGAAPVKLGPAGGGGGSSSVPRRTMGGSSLQRRAASRVGRGRALAGSALSRSRRGALGRRMSVGGLSRSRR